MKNGRISFRRKAGGHHSQRAVEASTAGWRREGKAHRRRKVLMQHEGHDSTRSLAIAGYELFVEGRESLSMGPAEQSFTLGPSLLKASNGRVVSGIPDALKTPSRPRRNERCFAQNRFEPRLA